MGISFSGTHMLEGVEWGKTKARACLILLLVTGGRRGNKFNRQKILQIWHEIVIS